MKYYEAKKGERIDNIAYEVYGTLEALNEVLLANKHLTKKAVLDGGDRVYLPVFEVKTAEIEGISLW